MNANFEAFQKQAQENMELATKSYEAMTKGMQEVAKEAADYTKSSYEAGVAAFEKLVAAKSFDKALEIQAAYSKGAYEAFVAQTTKMGEIVTGVAKDAYKPYEKMMPKAAAAK